MNLQASTMNYLKNTIKIRYYYYFLRNFKAFLYFDLSLATITK